MWWACVQLDADGRNTPTSSLWFAFSVYFLLRWTMCAMGNRAVLRLRRPTAAAWA